jgi:hypothetical protein
VIPPYWLYATKRGERPSQPCGAVSLPCHPALEQQPEPVIGEVAQAVPEALDLLDEQVDGLGGAVGGAPGDMPGQDLGLLSSYGAGKA